jgi:hypothetical protein
MNDPLYVCLEILREASVDYQSGRISYGVYQEALKDVQKAMIERQLRNFPIGEPDEDDIGLRQFDIDF